MWATFPPFLAMNMPLLCFDFLVQGEEPMTSILSRAPPKVRDFITMTKELELQYHNKSIKGEKS